MYNVPYTDDKRIDDFPINDEIQCVLTFSDKITRVSEGFRYILQKNEQCGNSCLYRNAFYKLAKRLLSISDIEVTAFLNYMDNEIVCKDNLIGFKSAYEKDLYVKRDIEHRTEQKSYPLSRCRNTHLTEEQFLAVKSCLDSHISIITGGAGTGKTTTINCIIKNFNRQYRSLGKKVFVLAPTGKASKRDKETITEECQISTVHYFLGYGHPLSHRDYSRMNSAGLIIIDEASMLNTAVFYELLNRTSAPIVLVGDANQLPSVDYGDILRDLIQIGVPTYRLTTNFRNTTSILQNANNIITHSDAPLITDASFETVKVRAEDVVTKISEISADILLTPYRTEKISGSCTDINTYLHHKAGYHDTLFHRGEPVIVTHSDRKLGIVNGETGTVSSVTADEVYVNFEDRTVAIKDLSYIDWNYASTIHKSQGSEYRTVAIYCPKTDMMNANMLYTAITRAKEKCILLYTEDDTFDFIKNNNLSSLRHSFLQTNAA